jgi:hypothetical protein
LPNESQDGKSNNDFFEVALKISNESASFKIHNLNKSFLN